MAATGKSKRLDLGTLGGLAVAVAGILGGYLLEGGKPGDVLGESAALIVFGGCLGATLVANPIAMVRAAARRVRDLLFEEGDDSSELVERLVGFSQAARKQGIVSLEQDVLAIEDPFLRKAMLLAVDGMDLQEIRSIMELEMDTAEHRAEAEAKVFESAGGFAPTIGIIGAVLGLIIVMGDLKDMDKVGKGIAAAFVATIYGVGSANLMFLPAAHKIKARAARARLRQELILEGVCGIVEGMNPKMIRAKLEAYLEKASQRKPRAVEAARAA
ncbi:MAG: flagellar motor protein [Bryobacteraceae bacterium]|nr:flagellar motor protein [Bryobacteraceae bacterium]